MLLIIISNYYNDKDIKISFSVLAVSPKTSNVNQTESTKTTFTRVKEALNTLVTLKFYDPSCQLQLTTNASDLAFGAVLQQIRNGIPEPLEFFPRTLNSAQKTTLLLIVNFQPFTILSNTSKISSMIAFSLSLPATNPSFIWSPCIIHLPGNYT